MLRKQISKVYTGPFGQILKNTTSISSETLVTHVSGIAAASQFATAPSLPTVSASRASLRSTNASLFTATAASAQQR